MAWRSTELQRTSDQSAPHDRARRWPAASSLEPGRPDRANVIETTSMPITQVAFAAGFTSVRQFNDTIREVFASSPRELPARADRTRPEAPLAAAAYRPPFTQSRSSGSSATAVVPGIETWDGATYRRSLRLNHGNAVIALSPGPDRRANALTCTLHLDNVADAQAAVQRCRRWTST